MKDKIIFLVIGILIGAIVATGAFYIYNKSNNTNNIQMNGGQPPELPNGQSGTPPEKPSGEMGEIPEMTNNNSNESNN